MTAPTRTRRQPAPGATRERTRAATSRTTTTEREAPQTPVRTPPRRRTQQRGRTSAAERAYARRAQRTEEMRRTRAAEALRVKEPVKKLGLGRFRPKSRASFVLLMMSLLAAGVATTLWLSTQAIADSYKLEEVRQDNAGLAEQAELLQRDVTKAESASALADKARQLGMVPGGDPARIVVNPDGSTKVVGEPKKATASAPAPASSTPAQPSAPQGGRPMEGDISQAGEEPADAQAPAVQGQAATGGAPGAGGN